MKTKKNECCVTVCLLMLLLAAAVIFITYQFGGIKMDKCHFECFNILLSLGVVLFAFALICCIMLTDFSSGKNIEAESSQMGNNVIINVYCNNNEQK